MIRELICSRGGPAVKRTMLHQLKAFLEDGVEKTSRYESKKENNAFINTLKIKQTRAEPCCAKVYLQALNMQ